MQNSSVLEFKIEDINIDVEKIYQQYLKLNERMNLGSEQEFLGEQLNKSEMIYQAQQ